MEFKTFIASVLLTCEHLIKNELLLDLYWRTILFLPISFANAYCFKCGKGTVKIRSVNLEVRSDSTIVLASHTANSEEFLKGFLSIMKSLGVEVKIR